MSIFSKAKSDMSFIKINPRRLSEKGIKKRKRGISTLIGIILSVIMAVCIALGVYGIYATGVVPWKWFFLAIAILFGLWLFAFLTQYSRTKLPGKIVAVAISVIMIMVFMFANKFTSSLSALTQKQSRTDVVDVVVLDSDKAESIKDTLEYDYGYNTSGTDDICKTALGMLNQEYNSAIKPTNYSGWDDLFEALENKDIQALLIKDTVYESIIKETYSDFYEETKVVGQITVVTEISDETAKVDVTKEPFVIYLSGNDEQGEIKSTGRSDVNILLVANPNTRQILLVSTPRDSYITIEDENGNAGLDKLTHAGLAGVEYSEKALSELYNVQIHFFMKVNFTGVVDVVDTLGGIDVDSEVEFSNGTDAAPEIYHFEKGQNHLTGAMALAFCRERHTFLDGDFQRGRNQMAVMQGVINKMTSSAILTNYSPVLDAFTRMIYTDMPVNSITSLIRSQLSGGEDWNIQSYSIDGDVGVKNGQVYGLKNMSVVLPYDNDVEVAREMISKIINGETFDVTEYVKNFVPSGTFEIPTRSKSSYSDDDEDTTTSARRTTSSYDDEDVDTPTRRATTRATTRATYSYDDEEEEETTRRTVETTEADSRYDEETTTVRTTERTTEADIDVDLDE